MPVRGLPVRTAVVDYNRGIERLLVPSLMGKNKKTRMPLTVVCPCYDYVTFTTAAVGEICPVCWWCFDGLTVNELDVKSAANHDYTLDASRAYFAAHGTCGPHIFHGLYPRGRGGYEHRGQHGRILRLRLKGAFADLRASLRDLSIPSGVERAYRRFESALAGARKLVDASVANEIAMLTSMKFNDEGVTKWAAQADRFSSEEQEEAMWNALQVQWSFVGLNEMLTDPVERLARRNLVLKEVLTEMDHVRLRLEILCGLIGCVAPFEEALATEFKNIVIELAAELQAQMEYKTENEETASDTKQNEEKDAKGTPLQRIASLERNVNEMLRTIEIKISKKKLNLLYEKLVSLKEPLAWEHCRHQDLALKWAELADVAVQTGDENKMAFARKIRDGYIAQANSSDESYALFCSSLAHLQNKLGASSSDSGQP